MNKTVVAVALVAGLVGGVLGARLFVPKGSAAVHGETAYERVMRTKTLRCGYAVWEPSVMKDSATGKMSGSVVDMLNEAAGMADLKIDWVAEIDWGQIAESLHTGKIDAFCAGQWSDSRRGKQTAYSLPLYYMRPEIFVRADDKRFPDGKVYTLAELNKPEYRTAYTEGDVIESIVKTELPQVKGVPLPTMGTPSDNLMNLLTGKTDLFVNTRLVVMTYEKANGPGKVRALKLAEPLRVYGGVTAVDINEPALLQLMNSMFNEFINSGSYNRIYAPYAAQYPGIFLRPAKTYEEPK